MPPKRRAPTDTAASSKRFRSAIDESMDEFSCPITCALPLDPVLAEDGRVYERAAIERWLKQKAVSPSTNERMGEKLTPATQVKNMIERMVKTGALPDDKIQEWKQRIEEQEAITKLHARAEEGDANAAFKLGALFETGQKGQVQDMNRAFRFYEKSAKAGHAKAMGMLANCYRHGKGVAMNEALMLRWAAAGVALDNGYAMVELGNMYRKGRGGLPKDQEEGFRLYNAGGERGFLNAKGMMELAKMYEKGEGTPIDVTKAVMWVRRAAAKGDSIARDWLSARGLQVEATATEQAAE
mmetsp:Transcript_15478/g.39950  ORF Transcript_15478/g.39950 Transcript_15478/m.39950 type:complete len:297 (-) Transcript_15478:261-1151(-)